MRTKRQLATAAWLAAGIFFSGYSLAASVPISNIPMAVQNTAKSNIMFTMDSSGGMDVETLIASYNSMYYESGITPNPGVLNGNFFLFPAPYRDNVAASVKAQLILKLQGDVAGAPSIYTDPLRWRARNAHYNPRYYDPFKTYQPWAGADSSGISFKNANPAAIQYDPYGRSLGTVDITQEIDSGATINGWSVPKAHTYLGAGGVDLTPSGGLSYNSRWFIPAYYVWSDLNNNGVMDAGEGTRYEIRDWTVTCTATDSASLPATVIPGCNGTSVVFPSGRTYQSELQNFANWFQYYRTNMLAMQGAVGKQIPTLGATQAGMTALYQRTIPYPVADMSVPANVASLQSGVYSILPNLGDWSQPIHERMNNVFSYFSQNDSVNGVPAPIQYACQQNFNILATPGYLNESSSNRFKNPFTGVTPALFPVGDYDSTGTAPGAATIPYADWSKSGNPSYPDTLADWSLYIYNQNLRPDLTAGQVPLLASAHETNPNPHLDTYVISPGAAPVLGGSPRYLNPSTTNPYSVVPSIDWPQPGYVSQSTLDDLWHASVNGRGMFVTATDTYGGLSIVLNDIMGRIGAAAAVAVSNANISPGDNFSYASSYNSGNWSGDLQAYPIDINSGQPSVTGLWKPSARDQIDAQVMTNSRFIATSSSGTGVPFRWNNLLPSQQSTLNSPVTPPGTSDGANVLQFLRGDRSLEGTAYRIRAHVLGDIIDAEPVIVREPMAFYTDNGYAAYKTLYSTTTPRLKTVYQAANDGMVHAFNAGTGAELWAYVPGLMFNSMLPTFPSTSVLAGLTLKNGFSHQYLVDGTPSNGDVDFGNTAAGVAAPDWHSILVGGLGRGGRGYYALDVTQPVVANELQVAAKSIWEFPNAATPSSVIANVGYSYGKPIIAKTAATGWVVIVTSGYNNGTNPGDSGGDGRGHLFVLNAKTGALIKDISTGTGSPSSPSGLAQISGWVNNGSTDNTVQQVYGADLSGSIWRFDLSAKNTSGWSVTLLASLVDSSGMPQPISTSPELGLVNGKHMVYVGTGQYLSMADVTNQQSQSLYALIDDLSVPLAGTAVIAPLRSQLLKQTFTTLGGTQTSGVNLSLSSTQKGWYADLPIAGERVITAPAIANTTLVFTANIPGSSDPCHPGGSSWIYALNYVNGNQVAGSNWAGMALGNTLASRPILVQMPDGTIKALVRNSDATTASTTVPVSSATLAGRRISWREITR